MTYESILSDLKAKKYSPIYFLMGDEAYFIDQITNYIAANVLTDSERDFNYSVLYGKDIEVGAVINAAKRYPMMAKYQVVIIKEAQNIRNIDDLVYYAQNPLKSTLLVVNYKYKTLDKRKRLYKELEKNAILFEAKKLYDDKLPDWITTYLATRDYQIQPTGALMLSEFLGNDLNKIAMELEKLMLIIPKGEKLITSVHIEENIGISKDYNNIELQKALARKDHLKAFRIADHFAQNQKDNPLPVTLVMLFSFFNKIIIYHQLADKSRAAAAGALKINPFFVQDYQQAAKMFSFARALEIISELREYDLRSKGVRNISAAPGELLKELVYKILK